MWSVVCHILHIAATCTSLGGLVYSRLVLLPNLKYVPESARENYLNQMIKRFAYIKWIGVAVVAVTGVWQLLDIYPSVGNKSHYLLAFGLKMTGAVGLFSVTFLLALPSEKTKYMHANRAFWSGLNIAFGLIILTGAALMRSVRN